MQRQHLRRHQSVTLTHHLQRKPRLQQKKAPKTWKAKAKARGWKQDATTKGGKPKVVKEAKVATTDNQANKNQFDKIKTPNIDLTRETKVKYKKSDVAKAPKTESLEPLSRSERKVARKKKSIDKKLAKAKVARESGNLKKAARKEKRAGNKVERKYGIRKQMRQTDRQTKQMNRGLDKLQKKTEKLLKENTK